MEERQTLLSSSNVGMRFQTTLSLFSGFSASLNFVASLGLVV